MRFVLERVEEVSRQDDGASYRVVLTVDGVPGETYEADIRREASPRDPRVLLWPISLSPALRDLLRWEPKARSQLDRAIRSKHQGTAQDPFHPIPLEPTPLLLAESWFLDPDDEDYAIEVTPQGEQRSRALDYDTSVRIYEARVRDWFLNVARGQVARGLQVTDYQAVATACAYIEGVEQFREGLKGRDDPRRKDQSGGPRGLKSERLFDAGAARIFVGTPPDLVDKLFGWVRCGLFHAGFTDGPVHLSYDGVAAIEWKPDPTQTDSQRKAMTIHPRLFVEKVCQDFDGYLQDLRDPTKQALRQNFEIRWKHLWENS